jgi:5-methylcytosine-specific restriction endonuclease McrA
MSEISYPLFEYRPAGRLKPPVPLHTQQAVKTRAAGCCEVCGARCAIGQRLELHHTHYENEGYERPEDLLALCRRCHRQKHVDENGEFWPDPQEMQDHWRRFYEESEVL